jgi:hypothetical protein
LLKLAPAASAVNHSNLSTALIPYADARRELRLTRYVCDKHIRAGRLRTVVAGRNLFIVREDVVTLGRELRAAELVGAALRQFDSLSWVERARIHRLPVVAMGRRLPRARILCTQHAYRAILEIMGGPVCAVEQAAALGLMLRLRTNAERCEQCARHGPFPESEKVGYLRESVDLRAIDGNRSRTYCAAHFLDVMWDNAEDDTGVIGDAPGTRFAAESAMLLLAYCHIGERHELCSECARAVGAHPIGKGISSGEVRHVELF